MVTFDHQAAVEATEALEVPPAQLFCELVKSSSCDVTCDHRSLYTGVLYVAQVVLLLILVYYRP